jgi:hypothetical protein
VDIEIVSGLHDILHKIIKTRYKQQLLDREHIKQTNKQNKLSGP